MASYSLHVGEFAGTPVHVAFSPSRDQIAVLFQDRKIKIWDLRTRLGPGRGNVLDPIERCVIDLKDELKSSDFRQICFWEKNESSERIRLACLASVGSLDFLVEVEAIENSEPEIEAFMLPEQRGRLVESVDGIYWQSSKGAISSVSGMSMFHLQRVRLLKRLLDPLSDESLSRVCRFPEFCFHAEIARLDKGKRLFVGRSGTNKLYCAIPESENIHVLAPNCNSFIIASGFVIFTTTSHEASFAPLATLYDNLTSASSNSADGPRWEQRRVERGAQIVTAVPSNMALVLQMPRGNLETIYPRPLVTVVVKKDIDE